MELNYQISSLTETGFTNLLQFSEPEVKKEDIGFSFSHRLSVDKASSSIAIDMEVVLESTIDARQLIKNSVRAVFLVEPFDDMVVGFGTEGITVSEPRLMDTFISITVGALRGTLAKNLKQTPFEGCVLPLIPMDVIRKTSTKQG